MQARSPSGQPAQDSFLASRAERSLGPQPPPECRQAPGRWGAALGVALFSHTLWQSCLIHCADVLPLVYVRTELIGGGGGERRQGKLSYLCRLVMTQCPGQFLREWWGSTGSLLSLDVGKLRRACLIDLGIR